MCAARGWRDMGAASASTVEASAVLRAWARAVRQIDRLATLLGDADLADTSTRRTLVHGCGRRMTEAATLIYKRILHTSCRFFRL